MRDAIQAARAALKISRNMQQFPNFPLVFGNYELPVSPLSYFGQMFPPLSYFEVYSIYRNFLAELQTLSLSPAFGKLVEPCFKSALQRCFSEFKHEQLKVNLSPTDFFEVAVLDHKTIEGTCSTIRELNPPDSALKTSDTQTILDLEAEPYRSIYSQKALTQAAEISPQDLSRITYKLRYQKPLNPKEERDLKLFHLHLNEVGAYVDVLVLGVKGGQLITITNRAGELEDGESSENSHVLQLERMCLIGESPLIPQYFSLNNWMMADTDLLMTDQSN